MTRPALVACLLALMLIFVAVVSIAGEKSIPAASPLSVQQLPEFRISRGAVLYRRYCLFCHGESGKGDGLNASLLPISPRDLGDPDFLKTTLDDTLRRVILNGGKSVGLSSSMPSFGQTFNPVQADMLVSHIRTTLVHPADEDKVEDTEEPEL